MTSPTLHERLAHLVASVPDAVFDATYPAASPPPALAILGSIRPLRTVGGRAAAERANETFERMPPGYVDVWLHRKAAERRESSVLAEASRRDVDVHTFATNRLDHLASWGHAQLDPPRNGEEPGFGEADARAVALAALQHEGLPPRLLGEHLLFCRYTFEATRRQPVWLALFEVHHAPHLIVINADSDMLLEPVEY